MKSRLNRLILSKPILYMLIVIFLAIVFRFIRFTDFATFGHDNSRDNIVAFKMFEYGEYIYVGPVFSVIWGYMSPIYYYLLYPFFLLFKFSPLSAPIASMVANIVALLLLVYVALKYYGKAAAFIVAVLFGFSVYIIKQGGEGLNPSLMVPFSVLGIYSYIEWLKSSKGKFLYWFAFALSFITALHPAGFFLLLPFIILYFIYKPKFDIKSWFFASSIYGVLGILPYLIQEKKLAWWTIKQFIEYFKSEDKEGASFLQSQLNYWFAVCKNISLALFNDVNNIGILIAVLILGFLLYGAIRFFKDKNNSTVLAFILLIYLMAFGLAVNFPQPEPHTKWFAAVFIPIVVLYITSLLTRLYRTNYWYGTLLILVGVLLLNVRLQFTLNREADSFSYMKEVSEVIRADSQGEPIDIYGLNPEPIYYMMWHYEQNPEAKDMYFSWIKWAREKDNDIVYFVQDKYALDHNTIEKIKDKHGTETYEEIYTSETGNKIYLFK